MTGPGKGKKKANTTSRKSIRKVARKAAKASREGKSTLVDIGNSSWKKKGATRPTTYESKDGNTKVKKREIKKALKSANAGRGDKVVVDKGEVKTIKKKPLTRDQKIAALKKKKADFRSRANAAKAKRSAEIAAKRKALKAKQDAVRAKKGYKK